MPEAQIVPANAGNTFSHQLWPKYCKPEPSRSPHSGLGAPRSEADEAAASLRRRAAEHEPVVADANGRETFSREYDRRGLEWRSEDLEGLKSLGVDDTAHDGIFGQQRPELGERELGERACRRGAAG